MKPSKQACTRKFDAMSRRKYTIRRDAGRHLTDRQREILGRAWNQYVNRLVPVSLREFARLHNVPHETWRREYRRGAAGRTVRSGNRWTYAEYDLEKARASTAEGRANMGAGMKLTVGMAILFRHAVLNLGRSPYDARMMLREAFPDRDVPCLKTFYNHVESGDMGVFHGDTPYRPGRRRRPGTPAHEARVVPGRRRLADRPRAADEARELGHWEMDTVVSGCGSRGGLLVLLDRCSRRYVVERIGHVSQDEVVRAVRRMKARNALPTVRSVTTDNGCEFLDQRRLDRVFKARVYYTRAYASYEKGAVENCNRLVRRWYPKGTDFSRLTRRQVRDLEDTINSIHRESLNGETAYAYDSRLAQTH